MSRSRGYGGYKGRIPKGKLFLAICLVLITVMAVSAALLSNYLVYDSEGKPHLSFGSDREGEKTLRPEDMDVTVEPVSDSPEIHREVMAAYVYPQTPLSQNGAETTSAVQAAEKHGCNAVLLTLKDVRGIVYYESDAAVDGAVKTASDTMTCLKAWTGSDTHVIAQLSCFHDSRAALGNVERMGLKNTGGYIFYDGKNSQWLDPTKEAARQYLLALIEEVAQLGVDEILLTDVSYPTEGKLDKIAYGEGRREAHLALFLEQAKEVLAPYPVLLSVELSANTVETGSDAVSGQSLADAASAADRIYVRAAQDRAQALAERIEDAGEPGQAVIWLEEADGRWTGNRILEFSE